MLLGANPAVDPNNVGLVQKATYDAANNLLTATDGRGTVTSSTYNQFNQVVSQTDGENHVTRLDYFPDTGLLHTVTDPLGNVTTYAYDATGDRISETDPTGAVTTIGYDATGRVVATTDPRGHLPGADPGAFTSTWSYDGENRVRKATDALGHFRLWSYDNASRLRTYTDANTFATTFVYDDANHLLRTIDPDLRTMIYGYTGAGRLGSTTDGAGDTTRYRYDVAGRLGAVTAPRGALAAASPGPFTTTFGYDFNGRRTSQSRLLQSGQPAVTQYGYDSLGNLIAVVDPIGRTTRATYDQASNRVSALDPANDSFAWSYDGNNQVKTATDGLGNVTTNQYDADRRLVSQQKPQGERTTYAYDGAGRLTSQTSPRGFSTTFAHDVSSNLVAVTDPLGNTSTVAYDAADNVTARVDANGHATRYTYDAANRLVTIQAPDASSVTQVTTNAYDHAGHVIGRTDPRGFTSRYTYDGAGRLSSSIDAIGRVRQYSYDANGNLTALLTARATQSGDPAVRAANTITQQFDNLDRIVNRTLGSGPSFAFGYDAANQLTSLADGAGQQTRAYDAAGRLIQAARGGVAFGYTYDGASNLTGRTLPDGSGQSLGYDADNRPVSLTGPAGRTAYAYDPDSNLVDTQLPGGSEQQRTYDNADRLTSLSDLGPARQVLASYGLTRDAVGNPLRMDSTQRGVSRSDAFTFDPANRVTAMCFQATTCNAGGTQLSFAYDLVGNRLTRSLSGPGGFQQQYFYDAADQLSFTTGGPPGTVIYAYDADGNQTQAGGTRSTYDLDNQLATVDDGTRTTVYTQDAAGNRLGADATPDSGGATVHSSYQWDVNNPLSLLAVEQSGGDPARSYTYNPGGGPLSLQVGGGSFLYQPDAFGSTAELTDRGGAVQQQFRLTDPFGGFEQTTPGGAGAPDARLDFQGQYNDPLSGTYHMRAREYSSDIGRFDSVDPVSRGPRGPIESAYVYADDNPLTGSDPSGRFTIDLSGVVQNLSSIIDSIIESLGGQARRPPWPGQGVAKLWQAGTGAIHWKAMVVGAVYSNQPGVLEWKVSHEGDPVVVDQDQFYGTGSGFARSGFVNCRPGTWTMDVIPRRGLRYGDSGFDVLPDVTCPSPEENKKKNLENLKQALRDLIQGIPGDGFPFPFPRPRPLPFGFLG